MTQNVFGKSWWEERVSAASQTVEAATNAAQDAKVVGKVEFTTTPKVFNLFHLTSAGSPPAQRTRNGRNVLPVLESLT